MLRSTHSSARALTTYARALMRLGGVAPSALLQDAGAAAEFSVEDAGFTGVGVVPAEVVADRFGEGKVSCRCPGTAPTPNWALGTRLCSNAVMVEWRQGVFA